MASPLSRGAWGNELRLFGVEFGRAVSWRRKRAGGIRGKVDMHMGRRRVLGNQGQVKRYHCCRREGCLGDEGDRKRGASLLFAFPPFPLEMKERGGAKSSRNPSG